MDSFDPHVILTQQGDWIDMPALFNLSERVGQPCDWVERVMMDVPVLRRLQVGVMAA